MNILNKNSKGKLCTKKKRRKKRIDYLFFGVVVVVDVVVSCKIYIVYKIFNLKF